MFDRDAQLMGTETSKAQSVGKTLRRLWGYFRLYALALVMVALAVIGGTYMQVLIPDLTGQAVDCYLGPYAAREFEDALAIVGLQIQNPSPRPKKQSSDLANWFYLSLLSMGAAHCLVASNFT
jgi:ABC-type multidrug transport system fused ATPase/permease subunit